MNYNINMYLDINLYRAEIETNMTNNNVECGPSLFSMERYD